MISTEHSLTTCISGRLKNQIFIEIYSHINMFTKICIISKAYLNEMFLLGMEQYPTNHPPYTHTHTHTHT